MSGKRDLSLRQMRDLARRFAVPVAAFIDETG
jgi:antitoxin component HigA of HigAB toxin-antitoxin module